MLHAVKNLLDLAQHARATAQHQILSFGPLKISAQFHSFQFRSQFHLIILHPDPNLAVQVQDLELPVNGILDGLAPRALANLSAFFCDCFSPFLSSLNRAHSPQLCQLDHQLQYRLHLPFI